MDDVQIKPMDAAMLRSALEKWAPVNGRLALLARTGRRLLAM